MDWDSCVDYGAGKIRFANYQKIRNIYPFKFHL